MEQAIIKTNEHLEQAIITTNQRMGKSAEK